MIKNKIFTALMFTTAISTSAFAAVPLLASSDDLSSIIGKLVTFFDAQASATDGRDQLAELSAKLMIAQNEIQNLIQTKAPSFEAFSGTKDIIHVDYDVNSVVDFSTAATLEQKLELMFKVTDSVFPLFTDLPKLEAEAAKVTQLEADLATAQTEAAKVAQLTSDLATAQTEAAKVAQLTSDLATAKTEAAKVTGLQTQVFDLTIEANKAVRLLANQSALQARITELEKQITDAGGTVGGTEAIIMPVAPVVISLAPIVTTPASTVEYTLSDGSKIKLTDDQVSIIRAAKKSTVGMMQKAAIQNKTATDLLSALSQAYIDTLSI